MMDILHISQSTENRNLPMNLKFVTTYLKSYTKRPVHVHKPYKCKTGSNVSTGKYASLTKRFCCLRAFLINVIFINPSAVKPHYFHESSKCR